MYMYIQCITQYGSTVYIGIAMGGPALWPYIKNNMMHQVLYIVQLPNEEGDMHII